MADNYQVDPSGKVVTVPNPQEGLEAGNSAASPEQIQQFQEQQALQTPEAQLATGLGGTLRTATFGISDALLRALGGHEATDKLRQLNEANPGSALLGETAGFISPDVLAGIGAIAEKAGIKNAGKAGKFVGDYLTAPGLAHLAGEAVADRVAPKVTKLAAPFTDYEAATAAGAEAGNTAAETAQAAERSSIAQELAKRRANNDLLRQTIQDLSGKIRAVENGSLTPLNPNEINIWRTDLKESTDALGRSLRDESNLLRDHDEILQDVGQDAFAPAAKEATAAHPPTIAELPPDGTRVEGVTAKQAFGAEDFPVEDSQVLPGTYYTQNGRAGITPFGLKATEGILPGIASGATEFGLYGLGNVISEAALSDPADPNSQMTLGKGLATIGLSSLLGGGFGGLGGLVGGLGKATLEKLANSESGIFLKRPKLLDLIQNINEKIGGGVSPGYDYDKILDSRLKALGLNKEITAALSGLTKTGTYAWDKSALFDTQALAEALNDDRKTANKTVDNVEPSLESFPKEAAERAGSLNTVSNAADRTAIEARSALDRVNSVPGLPEVRAKLGDISASLERAVTPEATIKALYDAEKYLSDITAEYKDRLPQTIQDIRKPLRDFLGDEGNVGKGAREFLDVQDNLAKFKAADDRLVDEVATRTLGKNLDFKTEFTPESFKNLANDVNTPAGQARVKAVSDWYSAHTDLADSANAFRKSTGRFDTDLDDLLNASRVAQQYHYAATSGNAAAENAERAFAPSASNAGGSSSGNIADFLGAQLAGHASEMLGHGAAHVLGAGALGGAAVHVARKVLPKLFKYALDNPGEAAHVLSTLYGVTQKTTQQIERGVARSMSKGNAGSPVRRNLGSFDKVASAVTQNANDMEGMINRVNSATETISKYAPNTAAAIATTTSMGISYLKSVMPQAGRAGVIGPKLEVPKSEQDKFLAIADVVVNPTHIVDAMRAGTMTPDLVQAVRTVHPDVAQKIASELAVSIEAAKHPLSGTQQLMASMFLGMDATGIMSNSLPSQKSFADYTPNAAAPIQKASSGSPAAGKVSLAERMAPGTVENTLRDRP